MDRSSKFLVSSLFLEGMFVLLFFGHIADPIFGFFGLSFQSIFYSMDSAGSGFLSLEGGPFLQRFGSFFLSSPMMFAILWSAGNAIVLSIIALGAYRRG